MPRRGAMKRLLLLASEFPPGPGGIGTHAWNTARWLSRMGWQVRVRACQDYVTAEERDEFAKGAEFELVGLGGARIRGQRGAWLAAGCLVDTMRWRPGVVLATGANAVRAAALAGQVTGRPVAAVVHGSEVAETVWWKRASLGAALRRMEVVLAVSRYTAARVEELGVTARRIEVVPNGADEERFRPAEAGRKEEIRRRLGVAGGPVILTVGSVTRRKGQEWVVRALPFVIERAPGLEYWVAGLPLDQPRLSEVAQELGVDGRVRFWGRVDAGTLLELYQAADVFAMTSEFTPGGDYEGFGIAVIEAALCGLPAVVSDCGGLPEAVVEGETGLVVRQRDVEGIGEALARLASDTAGREAMGRAARKRALDQCTWAQRMRRYDRLLSSLLEGEGAG